MFKINTSYPVKAITAFSLLVILVSCSGGGGNSDPNLKSDDALIAASNQAILGPLSGASIRAYRLGDMSAPVESTTAQSSTTNLDVAGSFDLTLTGIPDTEWILVTATGGSDIDADDNGVIDVSPTPNSGTISALATAADWRSGGKINILTDLAWREVKTQVEAGNTQDLADRLQWIANTFLSDDITGDNTINYKDLIEFNPRTQIHRQKMAMAYERFLETDNQGFSLIDYIHGADDLGVATRVSIMLGDDLALPEAPTRVVVQAAVTMPDNRQGVVSQDVTVSGVVSGASEVADSSVPTVLVGQDSAGRTVMLALATKDGGLLGETRGSVDLNVRSTATALVAFATGLPRETHDTSLISAITSHSKFGSLVQLLADSLAADVGLLDRLMEYPSLVSLIKEIAGAITPVATASTATTASVAKSVATVSTATTGSVAKNVVGARLMAAKYAAATQSDFYCYWFFCSPWADKQPWNWWEGTATGAEAFYPDNLFDAVFGMISPGYVLAEGYADLFPEFYTTPFLATTEADQSVLALANPTSANYAFEMYRDGTYVDWRITPRNSTVVQKLLASGAAKRELNIPLDISAEIDKIRFQRYTWSKDISARRAVMTTLNSIHLVLAGVQVFSDASEVSKTIRKIIGNPRAVTKLALCAGSLADTVDYGIDASAHTAKEQAWIFIKKNFSSVTETFLTSGCISAVAKLVGVRDFAGIVTRQLIKSAGASVLKGSNPVGWAKMAFDAANQLVPVATSVLAPANESVEYNLQWSTDQNGVSYISNVTKHQLPVVDATIRKTTGMTYEFDARASTVDTANGALPSHQWDFGDGQTATRELVSNSYSEPGPKTVTLTVSDNLGNSTSKTFVVDVSNGSAPVITNPVCGLDNIDRTNPTRVSFNATISDVDGDLSEVRWYLSAADSVPTITTPSDWTWGVVLQYPNDGLSSYAPAVEAVDMAGNVSNRTTCFTSSNVSGGIDLTNGLVAYYPFDGDATDASGNGNNGIENGAMTYVAGMYGQAASFDGVDDYVSIQEQNNFNSLDKTICSWIKTSVNDSNARGIVNKYQSTSLNGFNLFLRSGKIFFYNAIDSNNFIRSDQESQDVEDLLPVVSDNQWHHICTTIDAYMGRLFIDGQNVFEKAWIGSAAAPTSNEVLTIGSYPTTTTNGSFDGFIDNVRIYNRALNAGEVAVLAGSGSSSALRFSENFSVDPGYPVRLTSNVAGTCALNWSNGSYYAKVTDNSADWYCLAEGPTFNAVGASDGFRIEFDFNPVKPDWGQYPGLYFVDSTAGNFLTDPSVKGLGFTINWADNVYRKFTLRGTDASVLSPSIPAIDEWYHVVIAKDSATGDLSWKITRADGSVFVDQTTLAIQVGTFDKLYIGEGQWGPIKYGNYAEIRVDNITIQ